MWNRLSNVPTPNSREELYNCNPLSN
jgi:hypothetical protein